MSGDRCIAAVRTGADRGDQRVPDEPGGAVGSDASEEGADVGGAVVDSALERCGGADSSVREADGEPEPPDVVSVGGGDVVSGGVVGGGLVVGGLVGGCVVGGGGGGGGGGAGVPVSGGPVGRGGAGADESSPGGGSTTESLVSSGSVEVMSTGEVVPGGGGGGSSCGGPTGRGTPG
ncbi:hypothetical protein GCM10027271_27400 [Saccharopolyspora gloriosae]|uniref:Uncharacterized protein n=1 Tax=Saccharopolyspora gloriosae TaxID=455344 RepID=A0A840NK29_9PSEU|nr:hypothetical protein [Saccharopolyspora gloriosae]MBB5071421.1 hypothetical protein [Saccharopolyspora gloriosae]